MKCLRNGTACITDTDMQTIMHSIGRPEDFAAEDLDFQSQPGKKTMAPESESFTGSNYQNQGNIRQERFFRDENNKLVGGVCAGLANYFGIDKLVVRILFLIFHARFWFWNFSISYFMGCCSKQRVNKNRIVSQTLVS